jgi:hypothetical protein
MPARWLFFLAGSLRFAGHNFISIFTIQTGSLDVQNFLFSCCFSCGVKSGHDQEISSCLKAAATFSTLVLTEPHICRLVPPEIQKDVENKPLIG